MRGERKLDGNTSEGRGIQWLASEDRLPDRKERVALLAQGGQRAAHAGDPPASGSLPKQPDSLLNFECPQFALGLTGVERSGEVVEESEHRCLVEQEPIQQIARRRLLEPAALA